MAVLLCGGRALAHQSSVVYGQVVLDGRDVVVTLQVADGDLGPALGLGERKPSRAEVEAQERRVLDYLAEKLTVTNAGAACEPRPVELAYLDKAGGYFAVATIAYACKRTAAEVVLRYDLFFDLDPRHQGLFRVGERETVFRERAREATLGRPVGAANHVRDYFLLGVEHIFTGYDHLAFLFGLLAVAGFAALRTGLRYALGVVTAFTVAHSLTLIAAGLDWLRLPSRLVEPAIALSIAFVAVENVAVARPRRRWLVTFGFGLVHGFGFASVLKEIGLPASGVVLSLVSFNVGVEVGQLAVVALVAPMLWLLARPRRDVRAFAALAALAGAAFALLWHAGLPPVQLGLAIVAAPLALYALIPRVGYDRAVRVGGSLVLAAFGVYWLVERVLDKSFFGGALG